jgi:arylsulfatase A-like enzyme
MTHNNRPNILYIHSHDTGRHIQPYGHAVATPNMQRLAEGGMVFRQAFCAGPTCSPSRAGLLTGQCPHRAGMLGLAHRGFHMTDFSRHIIHSLGKVGYTSALSGIQHIAREAKDIGYDRILSTDHGGEQTALGAVEFLQNRPKQPFFLDVGFFETHRHGDTPEGWHNQPGPLGDGRYVPVPAPLPDTPRVRQDLADFNASAQRLDRKVGLVLEALSVAGLAGNTLVIHTTDHGIAYPGMKCHLTDHGMGVLLTLRGPGGFVGSKVCDAMVSHVDVFPTVCDVVGIEHPDWLEGKSLLPLASGQTDQINEEIFGEVTYHASYEPMRAVRTRRWKYIRRFDGRTTPVLPNCDDSLSKTEWLEAGLRDRPVAQEQLFDLTMDPNEVNNLIGESSKAGVLEEMRGRLGRWMRQTDDPLLRGPVVAPRGAQVNDPDGLSPNEPPRIVV